MTSLVARPSLASAPPRELGHTDRVESDAAPSDQDLINAAARGDAAAFDTLYLRHRDWLYCLAHRFTRDPDLAADVTQEVFSYLVRRLPTLKLTAKLTTFLYPVVKHESHAALRKRGRMQAAVPESAAPSSASGELSVMIRASVDALDEHQREIVLLRYVHAMELSDIAEALALPLGTVKSRLHRAIDELSKSPALAAYFT